MIDRTKKSEMELRDYFAAAALQGIMAYGYPAKDAGEVVGACYAWADAMMEERKVEG